MSEDERAAAELVSCILFVGIRLLVHIVNGVLVGPAGGRVDTKRLFLYLSCSFSLYPVSLSTISM